MDFIFKVDPIRRNIKVPDAFTVLTMDHNIHKLVFVCPYYEDFAFDSASIVFMIDAPDGKQYIIPAEDYESFPNSPAPYVKFTLTLKSYITSVVGYMSFCITADIISSGNVIEKSWHSKNVSISIGGHIDNDDSEDIPEEDVPTINQRLNNLDSKVGRLQTTVNGMANGSPTPVATVAEMTDESAVYLYTGSETGYTAGNWYYYDGSAWTSGGTYGGAVTSTTFDKPGVPADDFAVGQALAGKADVDDVTAIDTRVTAVESDVSDLKEDLYATEIFSVSDWENGGISASTGANVSNSSRIRTKSYLPWGIKKLSSTNSDVRFLVYGYNSANTYIGGWWGDGTFNSSDVKGVSSVDFNSIYSNPAYAGYKLRAAIYINNGTARVETISGIVETALPFSDFINLNANLSLDRVKVIPDYTDLDSLTDAGNWVIQNSASVGTLLNKPLFASTGGRLFVLHSISAVRPMQVYIGYDSTGSTVIYIRHKGSSAWYPWQRVDGKTARNIRVLGFNLGKFNYGQDGGLALNVETKISNFKRFIGNINPDITLTCECADYIDANQQYPTIATIFDPLYAKKASFNECAVFANAFDAKKLESDGGIYLRDNNNAYAGQVARQIIEVDGKQLLMSGGFLRVLGTETERYQGFVNYLASIANYEYSVIYLDTNVLSEEERVNIAEAATTAGYTICNGGYFGLIPTLHTEAMFRPIDNIFVKGNIKVKNFYVASDEYDNLSSDHYAIIADLSLY